MGKQPVRRIEFHNDYEYGIYDDHGYALEPKRHLPQPRISRKFPEVRLRQS